MIDTRLTRACFLTNVLLLQLNHDQIERLDRQTEMVDRCKSLANTCPLVTICVLQVVLSDLECFSTEVVSVAQCNYLNVSLIPIGVTFEGGWSCISKQ